MNRLLEILGRAATINTARLIWTRLNNVAFNQTDSTNSRKFEKVMNLIADMKLTLAEQELRVYLFDNPDCPLGRLAAATICLHKNDTKGAIESLNSVYLRQPNNTVALYALGHCYERLGQYAQAAEFYQDCLKFKNYLKLPRQRLAAIYFKNGQLEKTIAEYEQLRREFPDDITSLVLLGHLYLAQGNYDFALDIFNNAILIHPDSFCAEDNAEIDFLIHHAQFHDALEMLDDMSGSNPQRLDLIIKTAEVLSYLGDDAQAIAKYEQALTINPTSLDARIKLGTLYLKMQRLTLAAAQFDIAIEINDQIVAAYIGLATAQKLAAHPQKALTTLSLAAAIQPNSTILFTESESLKHRAAFDMDTADHIEAVEILSQNCIDQLKKQPKSLSLHYRFSQLMLAQSQTTNAISSLQTIIDANPGFSKAAEKLAICLFESDHKQAALNLLTRPQCQGPDILDLYYQTAILYSDRQKFAQSLSKLQTSMTESLTCPNAAANVAMALQNLGLTDVTSADWNYPNQTINTPNP